jgi:hypothetical protein
MSSQGIGWLLLSAATAGPAQLASDEAGIITAANNIRRKDIKTASC